MTVLSLATLAAEAATASASWLPTPAPMPTPSLDYSLGQLLMNLAVLLGILGLFAWGALAFMKGRLGMPVGLKAKGIRIEDRLPIDPQRSILVIGVDKRRFLVGLTTHTFDTIAELDPAQDFAQALDAEVRS